MNYCAVHDQRYIYLCQYCPPACPHGEYPSEVCAVCENDSALATQIAGDHYKDMAIQPVEYIHKNGLGFMEGCAIKYLSRHKSKHGAEDIRKAIHFCKLILEMEYGEK